jgi:hypothetical protein
MYKSTPLQDSMTPENLALQPKYVLTQPHEPATKANTAIAKLKISERKRNMEY